MYYFDKTQGKMYLYMFQGLKFKKVWQDQGFVLWPALEKARGAKIK